LIDRLHCSPSEDQAEFYPSDILTKIMQHAWSVYISLGYLLCIFPTQTRKDVVNNTQINELRAKLNKTNNVSDNRVLQVVLASCTSVAQSSEQSARLPPLRTWVRFSLRTHVRRGCQHPAKAVGFLRVLLRKPVLSTFPGKLAGELTGLG
jgi:hypothetical protein